MALLATVQGAFISQPFGPAAASVASREPAMWATNDKAWWTQIPGYSFFPHFHPGIDRAAPFGTAIRAMERGTVVFAGFANSVDGWKVVVEIRPGTRFQANHCSRVNVKVGQEVEKGQKIAEVGCTGSCTGNHTHESVSIVEMAGGTLRPILYDPSLFTNGGRLENDVRIQPERRIVVLNGTGINIRHHPAEFDSRSDVFAVSRDSGPWGKKGIYRLSTGNRIGPVTKEFNFIRPVNREEGVFYVVTGFHRRLEIRKSLCHFKD